MCLIKVLLNPFFVYLITPAVAREGMHVLGHLLKAAKIFITLFNENILVVDMIAREKKPYRRGKGKTTVAPVCRKLLISYICSDLAREVFSVG